MQAKRNQARWHQRHAWPDRCHCSRNCGQDNIGCQNLQLLRNLLHVLNICRYPYYRFVEMGQKAMIRIAFRRSSEGITPFSIPQQGIIPLVFEFSDNLRTPRNTVIAHLFSDVRSQLQLFVPPHLILWLLTWHRFDSFNLKCKNLALWCYIRNGTLSKLKQTFSLGEVAYIGQRQQQPVLLKYGHSWRCNHLRCWQKRPKLHLLLQKRKRTKRSSYHACSPLHVRLRKIFCRHLSIWMKALRM